ncbi:WXG100 family type VII secretion target [Flindersiella endophytica]
MSAASSDSVAMEQARGKIEETFDAIDGLRKGLVQYAEQNASEWTGQTAGVFQRVIGLTDEKLVKIGDALNTLATNVGGAAKAYASNEEQQAQTTSKFEGLLGG